MMVDRAAEILSMPNPIGRTSTPDAVSCDRSGIPIVDDHGLHRVRALLGAPDPGAVATD
jgi:hypothetical protein